MKWKLPVVYLAANTTSQTLYITVLDVDETNPDSDGDDPDAKTISPQSNETLILMEMEQEITPIQMMTEMASLMWMK